MHRRLSLAVAIMVPALVGCAPSRHVARHSPLSTTTTGVLAASMTRTTRTTGTTGTTGDAPVTPATLAAELVTAEAAVHDPATPEDRLADIGRRQVLAYRRLARHPEWMALVIGQLPATMRATAQRNLTAQLELQALTPPRTEAPPWRVRAPKPAADLLGWYHEAETASGVPWTYLAAIHLVETNFGRIHSPSTAGAVGPMQFLPATWSAYGRGDIEDDHDAIAAAARYLRANGAPADMASALFHYNRSVHYVRAITAYAEVLGDDPRAYAAYYHWPVLVRLTTGDVILPEENG